MTMLTREEMETRRYLGAQLLQSGLTQQQTARKVGVSRTSVSRWAQRKGDLARRRTPGRPQRVDRALIAAIYRELPDSAWTCFRLADAVSDQLGVTYHPDAIGRILRQLRAEAKGATA